MNREKSGFFCVTQTFQYRSDDKVENKSNMRRQREAAKKPKCDTDMNARSGISRISIFTDIER